MGDSRLWLCNTNGNVFTICTDHRFSKQLIKTYKDGVKLKCIAAHHNGAWGVSHNQMVYVFIHSSEVPIRIQETTYENQRWVPLRGFHRSHLLPTDRCGWTDEAGAGDQPRENFTLPSSHWEWDGDWTIDDNFHGEVTPDPEGWVYATDFPRPWLLEPKWKSCVRRRKWIRFRRYISTDVWALVSDTEVRDKEECFIHIAVGGFDMPNQPPGHLSVWAISSTGNIYVRTGVTRDCPEGEKWLHINTDTLAALNISVGPTGCVWIITWDGQALVRLGVNNQHIYGTDWVTVTYPDEDTRLKQLALGLNALWVLSREGKVWFRKGISGNDLISGNLMSATGTTWIEMVGEMSYITITPNDHVFAIGMDDQEIYYRAGVTYSDLGGKVWQKLQLQEETRHMGSTSSFTSETRHSSDLEESCYYDSVNVLSQTRNTPIRHIVLENNVEKSEPTKNEYSMHLDEAFVSQEHVRKDTNYISSVEVSDGINFDHSHGDKNNPLKINGIIDNDRDDIDSGNNMGVNEVNNEIGTNPVQSIDPFQMGDNQENASFFNTDIHISKTEKKSLKLSIVDVKLESKDSSVTDSDSDTQSPKSSKPFNFVTDLLPTESNEMNQDDLDGRMNSSEDVQNRKNSSSDSITSNIPSLNSIPKDKMAASESDDSNQATSISWVSLSRCEAYTGTIGDDINVAITKNQSACVSLPSTVTWNDDISNHMTPSSDHNITDMFVLTPAMPRYCWSQLSGLGCVIKNPSQIYWLQPRNESSKNLKTKIKLEIRQEIWKLLKIRNFKEAEHFQNYHNAIEKTTWVKKASMKWFHFGRHDGWLPCTVELEQGLEENDGGFLTVNYAHRGKQMHVQIILQDITCVYRVSTANEKIVFAVHTVDTVRTIKPHLLCPTSEAEANEWVSAICTANAAVWKIQSAVPPSSVWSTTLLGDVYVQKPPNCHVKVNERCWIPQGGHLEYIETSPCGVTWALGYNHIVWFYNGGHGGGVFKEQSRVSRDVHLQTDVRTMAIFEYQKWYPLVGYASCGLFRDNFNLKDKFRHQEHSKEDVRLPSSLWQWDSDWCIDYNTQGGVDNEGWQYAMNFNQFFHVRKGFRDAVRRRRWMRKCKLETLGPWLQVGQTRLGNISLQVDEQSAPCDPLVIWAVCTKGNLLCRIGVTREKPEGESWVHIPTDHLFHTVSVGGGYRVWAVANDGSAWHRTGVCSHNPQGSNWLQIVFPPEDGAAFTRISAGNTAVWVVDKGGTLWYRKDIMPDFPEGTCWVRVCNKVLDVSVGPSDQVWIVADANFCRNKHTRGVVYRRVDITEDQPAGASWETIIGSGWKHISVRGQIEQKNV